MSSIVDLENAKSGSLVTSAALVWLSKMHRTSRNIHFRDVFTPGGKSMYGFTMISNTDTVCRRAKIFEDHVRFVGIYIKALVPRMFVRY